MSTSAHVHPQPHLSNHSCCHGPNIDVYVMFAINRCITTASWHMVNGCAPAVAVTARQVTITSSKPVNAHNTLPITGISAMTISFRCGKTSCRALRLKHWLVSIREPESTTICSREHATVLLCCDLKYKLCINQLTSTDID